MIRKSHPQGWHPHWQCLQLCHGLNYFLGVPLLCHRSQEGGLQAHVGLIGSKGCGHTNLFLMLHSIPGREGKPAKGCHVSGLLIQLLLSQFNSSGLKEQLISALGGYSAHSAGGSGVKQWWHSSKNIPCFMAGVPYMAMPLASATQPAAHTQHVLCGVFASSTTACWGQLVLCFWPIWRSHPSAISNHAFQPHLTQIHIQAPGGLGRFI